MIQSESIGTLNSITLSNNIISDVFYDSVQSTSGDVPMHDGLVVIVEDFNARVGKTTQTEIGSWAYMEQAR